MYPKSRDEADRTASAIKLLEGAADAQWIGQRAAKFLAAHYFVPDAHDAVLEAIGRDWSTELKGYPEWAVDAAFDWWMSRHNPKRRNKPLPGDISERAQVESAVLTMGRKMVGYFERYGANPPAFLR